MFNITYYPSVKTLVISRPLFLKLFMRMCILSLLGVFAWIWSQVAELDSHTKPWIYQTILFLGPLGLHIGSLFQICLYVLPVTVYPKEFTYSLTVANICISFSSMTPKYNFSADAKHNTNCCYFFELPRRWLMAYTHFLFSRVQARILLML